MVCVNRKVCCFEVRDELSNSCELFETDGTDDQQVVRIKAHSLDNIPLGGQILCVCCEMELKLLDILKPLLASFNFAFHRPDVTSNGLEEGVASRESGNSPKVRAVMLNMETQ